MFLSEFQLFIIIGISFVGGTLIGILCCVDSIIDAFIKEKGK
jgi:hypothetical protein